MYDDDYFSHRIASRFWLLEPSHAGDQIARGCLDEEVIMVTHQDPFPDSEAGTLAALAQGLQEQALIAPVGRGKDAVELIAMRHQMVKGALKLDANLPRHGSRVVKTRLTQNRESSTDAVPVI